MTADSASIGPTLRTKVSTGYARLDEALQGGFLAGSTVVLNTPASDEVPVLLRCFLEVAQDAGLLICRTLSSAETVAHESTDVKVLVCSDKPVPPSKNVIPGKGIDNLTEVNLQINEALRSIQPKRLVLDILSDVLLRHKGLQTRRWLTELLERLRAKNVTTLAVLNPYMHPGEDVQAVVDLFDGNLEIIEKETEGTLTKSLRTKWMHGIEIAEKELPIIDLAPEPQFSTPIAPSRTQYMEPRWATALIGRAAELSKLKTSFDYCLKNRSNVVALEGEAGVGKSRLMQELAIYAQSKGAVVLSSSASQDGLPYGPWIELSRQYIAQAPSELLRRLLGGYLSEFARLVPDIVAKVGTVPPPKSLGEQQDKIRLYEAVTQFFIGITSESPLVLLVDDTQGIDTASIDLLEYVARSAANVRILTVLSYSEEDLDRKSALYETLMKFNRQRVLETVHVRNLSKEETIGLLKQIFGEPNVSPEFVDLIYQRTGGNPFFVEEVLKALVEEGVLYRTDKGWERKPVQEIELPESVRSALRSRIAKLDPELLNNLQWAALVGTDFQFDLLREISQVEEETLLKRLETALSAGLVTEVRLQRGVFRFADGRIRQLLLDDLSQLRRGKYHLKIAETMEKLYARNLQTHAEALANHYFEGGNPHQALKYSIMAGDRNMAIHAYDQAIGNYRHALECLDIEGGRDADKGSMIEKIAACYRCSGRLQESIQHYEQALTLYESLGDFKACARITASLSHAHEDVLSGDVTSYIPQAIDVLTKGLRFVEAEPDSFEAATIYSRLAWLVGLIDERYDEANTWLEKALRSSEKSGNSAALAESLLDKGAYLADIGKIDEALPCLQRALDASLEHENYQEAFPTFTNLCSYIYPRDIVKARQLAVRQFELAKRLNHLPEQGRAWRFLAYLDLFKGDWQAAREEADQALAIAERMGAVPPYLCEVCKAWLHLGLGDLEACEKYLEIERSRNDTKISTIVALNLVFGKLRLQEGREDEAKTHFETAVRAFEKWEFTTFPLTHIETLLELTGIYGSRKDLENARRMSQWAKRLAETLKSDAGLAMASQAEAGLLSATGDSKGAEEAYLKSLALWEKAGWPYYQAKTLVAYSETIAPTNPGESKKRLRQAAEIFRKLGAKRDLEKAENKLSDSA